MFYSITGTLIFTDASIAVIECGGVAFKCISTFNTLKKLGPAGSQATLFTYLNVREDALDLYGFYDLAELECYKMLTGVSGVGPKAGVAILSELTPEKVALCIASGDAKTMTRAQGVGPKLAQRIVLELKDKFKGCFAEGFSDDIMAAGIASASGNAGEAVSALVILGYSQSEASVAIGKLDNELPVEELIRQGLKMLARK